ncbi:tetratricopeptide repeat protein 31-like isoform X1 [Centrocercus urophasianus]|uniref:tetratricopeptide repeat protein 31-like isoform X1 n=1 Tax=Centrocercus urophasianus TaxID=9002 RepID=UPI001C64A6B4|nr:tetratricopeptide repeat protein 31-like isoform X1 [Centrocercus urophasianus]
MGDVPGPGLGFAPFAVPGWFCPESDGEEAEEEERFIPTYGRPPFAFYGPYGDPLLVPPRGFTDADAEPRGLSGAWRHRVTAEEAEKNAMELLAEEERMKKKAERKKLKKKKQKDRRKQEKLEQELRSRQAAASSTASPASAAGATHGDASSAEEESGCLASSPPQRLQDRAEEGVGDLEGIEDELDLSCTFVIKAWQKAGVKPPAPAKDKSVRADAAEPNKRLQEGAPEPPLPRTAAPQAPKPEPALLDTNMLEQSLILAGCGYQAAVQGRYAEAVQAFTEAIKLNPREHRLFGNRSYCYEKLLQYQEALRDAQMALELQPNWPKGFFRKGKALWGLKLYAEARDTFEQLLHLKGAHADVATRLEACQMLLQQSSLRDAGSPREIPALEAGEPLTPTSADECENGGSSDVDAGGFVTVVNSRSHSKSHVRNTATASPRHPLPSQHPARDCYPLWVGNITFKVTKKALQSCFGRFGQIQSIRLLPEKRCAFINFHQKAAAEAAYGAMLGAELEGCRLALQLKHPSHATPPPRQRP